MEMERWWKIVLEDSKRRLKNGGEVLKLIKLLLYDCVIFRLLKELCFYVLILLIKMLVMVIKLLLNDRFVKYYIFFFFKNVF